MLISSKATPLAKWMFPLAWFGVLAYVMLASLNNGAGLQNPLLLVVPFALVVIGFIAMRRLIWSLADRVTDEGDFLVVKKGSTEARIAFSGIMNVSAEQRAKPPRVTLKLAQPCSLGSQISFLPVAQASWNPFAESRVARDLATKAHAARTRSVI